MTPDMFVYLDLTWKSVVCKTQQKTALSNTWNDKQQTKPKNEGKKKWYNIWYIRFPLNMIKTGSVKPDRLTSAHNVVSHKAFKFTPYTWNLTFQKHGVFSNHVRTKIISNTTGTISHPHWLQITVHLDCLQNERHFLQLSWDWNSNGEGHISELLGFLCGIRTTVCGRAVGDYSRQTHRPLTLRKEDKPPNILSWQTTPWTHRIKEFTCFL